jgi:1-deoxy-D-xylulose-5-phosphate reductoisomerase
MPAKKLILLGSTGSIGKNALRVVESHPERFKVIGMAAGTNIRLLASQIKRHSPKAVSVKDEAYAQKLKNLLERPFPKIFSGKQGLIQLASMTGADMLLQGLVGSTALEPTMAAIKAGLHIAMANKEAIVMAGSLVMTEARKRGVKIIPVDSEHSAVFQILQGRDPCEVRRVILSASGGPFLRTKRKSLRSVTPEQALKHPTWNMGKKITIDSATLVNKALEVIEAHHLFGMPPEKIDVLVHPQSAVHAMVEFNDGSILAHLAVPDMRIPIGYALAYPERIPTPPARLKVKNLRALTFEPPDTRRFPAIDLAYQALKAGGTMPCVLNAANEVAVQAFLKKKITFDMIIKVIKKTMQSHNPEKLGSISDALRTDEWARRKAGELI